MELTILGLKCRLEIMIACVIVGFIIASFTICNCIKVTPEACASVIKNSTGIGKEGFQSTYDTINAASVDYSMNQDSKGSWKEKALDYAGNMGYDTVLASRANNKGTIVPLQNTMDFFKNNAFKPECCPSTYTSSAGCACTSISQLNYLNQRGGNRTLSSEF